MVFFSLHLTFSTSLLICYFRFSETHHLFSLIRSDLIHLSPKCCKRQQTMLFEMSLIHIPLSNTFFWFNCIYCAKISFCFCFFLFNTRSLLEQHMHCHREMVSVRVFDCPQEGCLFSGRSAAELRVHQSTHSNEKNHYCSVENCGYKTKTKALLNRWLQIVFFFGKQQANL